MTTGVVHRDVHEFPDSDGLANAPNLSGHLWVQELPTGGFVRFSVAPSGLISFGTRHETFEVGGDVPLAFRRAEQSLRTQLDVDALRAATEETDSITFFGIATWYEGIDYDWDTLPPVIGVDAWSGQRDAFLPPGAVTSAFEQLGLPALPAIETEVPADHAALEAYTDPAGMPTSDWHDGPVAGVLVRDKIGTRARAWHPSADRPAPLDQPPDDLAERFATDARIDEAAAALDTDNPTVEAVLERVLADIAREAYAQLHADTDLVVDERAFRSAVAERVQRRLEE